MPIAENEPMLDASRTERGAAIMPRSRPSLDHVGLLDATAFARAVSRQIVAMRMSGTPLSLSLIDLEGGLADTDSSAVESTMRLGLEIANQLRQRAGECHDVALLGAFKFVAVHDASRSLSPIVADIAAEVKPRHESAKVMTTHAHEVRLDGDLSELDSLRAIQHLLKRFGAARPGAFTPGSLSVCHREWLAESVEWSDRIRRAIGGGRFSLAFQPIVGMADGRIQHFEALLRLPDETALAPYEFVTMAEQLGSIAELDLAVAQRVIGLLRSAPGRPDSIAINVSGRSLVTPGFVDALVGQISRSADLAPFLLFEVTESAKITDLHSVNRALQTLRRFEIRVCLDDFGSGAAAFEYLRALEVDILKIDGSFIQDAAVSKFNRAFIRSIAALCDGLGIGTIAEMVEDEATARVVREAGISHGQGFHFGRPAPIESFGALLCGVQIDPRTRPLAGSSFGG